MYNARFKLEGLLQKGFHQQGFDAKERDTSEVLPVSVQPTDERIKDGNSGLGLDTAPETP